MQYVETIAIDRPQAVIWEFVGKPSNWSSWMEDMEDVQVEGTLDIGATLSYVFKGEDREATVIRYTRNQEITFRVEERNYDVTKSIRVRAMGSITSVSMTMTVEPKVWWSTAMTPLMQLTKRFGTGAQLRKSLHNLQQKAEEAQQMANA